MLGKLERIFSCSNRNDEQQSKLAVKVTDEKSTRKIGITVSSLGELKSKTSILFGLENASEVHISLADGTEVADDSYLFSLKSHTLLVVSKAKPVQSGSLQDAMQKYLAAVDELRKFHLEEILQFMQENSDEKLKLTWKFVSKLDQSKAHLSSIAEHPEWFNGCNKLVTTKEEYFRKCAQGRTRSYLRDAQTKLLANQSASSLSKAVIAAFKSRLESRHFYAGYFDRSHNKDVDNVERLCDETGSFRCEGKYNLVTCEHADSHVINPYETAESRILFSTWNLDHVVERAILLGELGGKLKMADSKNGKMYTHSDCVVQHYYDLLFTRKNLKLVHKSCHVIGPHHHAARDESALSLIL